MKSLRKILRRGLMLGLAASVGVTGSLWGSTNRFKADAVEAVRVATLNANDSFLAGRFSLELMKTALRHSLLLGADLAIGGGGAAAGSQTKQLAAALVKMIEEPEVQKKLLELYEAQAGDAKYASAAEYATAIKEALFIDADGVVNPLFQKALDSAQTARGAAGAPHWGAANAATGLPKHLVDAAAGHSLNVYPGAVAAGLSLAGIGAGNVDKDSAGFKELVAWAAAHALASVGSEDTATVLADLLPHSMREYLLMRDLLAVGGGGDVWSGKTLAGNADVAQPLAALDSARLNTAMEVATIVPMFRYGIPGTFRVGLGGVDEVSGRIPASADWRDAAAAAAADILSDGGGGGVPAQGHGRIDGLLAVGGAGYAGIDVDEGLRMVKVDPFNQDDRAGGYGGKFPQLLWARLRYTNANPLAGMMGLFHSRSTADLDRLRNNLITNVMGDPEKQAEIAPKILEFSKKASLHATAGTANSKLSDLFGDSLNAHTATLFPSGTFNNAARLAANHVAPPLASELAWKCFGENDAHIRAAASVGLSQTADEARETKRLLKSKFDALPDEWKVSQPAITDRANLGFLGAAIDSLSTAYYEGANAPAESKSLAKHVVENMARFVQPSPDGARALMTDYLRTEIAKPEFWTNFDGLVDNHKAGIRQNDLHVYVTDNPVAALSPKSLKDLFDTFVSKNDDGTNQARNTATPAAAKALVGYIVGKALAGPEVPLAALNTKLDSLIEAAFALPRVAGADGLDYENLDLLSAAVERIMVDYLCLQHGLISADSFIVGQKLELAKICGNYDAAGLDALRLAGLGAAVTGQAVLAIILRANDDGSLPLENESFNRADNGGHNETGQAWARLARIKQAFSVFDDEAPSYTDAFLDKIYYTTTAAGVQANPGAGGDVCFARYYKLTDRALTVAAGAGADATRLTDRVADFLTLLNDRAPQARNKVLLDVPSGVNDELLDLATYAKAQPLIGSLDANKAGVKAIKDFFKLDESQPVNKADNNPARLHTDLANKASQLRVFFQRMVSLNAGGVEQTLPNINDSRPDYISNLFRGKKIGDKQTGIGDAFGDADDDATYGRFLDARILFTVNATTYEGRARAILWYLNTHFNPVVKAMVEKINPALETNAGNHAALIAAVHERAGAPGAGPGGGPGAPDANITNTTNSAAAVDLAGGNHSQNALRAAHLSLLPRAGDAAAKTALYADTIETPTVLAMIKNYFKRGSKEHLANILLASAKNAGAGAQYEALQTYMASKLRDPAYVVEPENAFPGNYKKLIAATSGRNKAGGAAAADLFVRADISPFDLAATIQAMQAKLVTQIADSLTPADVEGQLKRVAEEFVKKDPTNPNPLLTALKTYGEGPGAQFVPGLNVMHEMLRAVDTTLWSVTQKSANIPGQVKNRVVLAPLYWQNSKSWMHYYALNSFAFHFEGDAPFKLDDFNYATEGMSKILLGRESLKGKANAIYALGTAHDGGPDAVNVDPDCVATHTEAAVKTYLVGAALGNCDFSHKSHMLFGPVEEKWFADAAGAKAGSAWAYDFNGAGVAADVNLGTAQNEWANELALKLKAKYGLEIARRDTLIPATAFGTVRDHAALFQSIKKYGNVLYSAANVQVTPGDAMTFAELRQEVAAFREIHNLYHTQLKAWASYARTEAHIPARKAFWSKACTRLFELLYAGVKPTVLLPVMKDIDSQLSADLPTVDAAKVTGIAKQLNTVKGALGANPLRATIVGDIAPPDAATLNPSKPVVGGGGAASDKKADTASTPVASTTKVVPVAQVEAASPASFATAAANSESLSAIPETVSASVIAAKADTFVAEQMSYAAKKQVAPVDVKLAAGLASFSSAKNVDLSAKPVTKMKAAERLVWNALGKQQGALKQVEAKLRRTKVGTAQYKKLRADKVAILNTAYKAAYAKEIAAKKRTLKAAPAKARASVQRKPAFSAKKPATATVKKATTTSKPAAKPVAGKAKAAAVKAQAGAKAPVKATTPAKPAVTNTKAAPAKATTTTKPAAKPVAGKAPTSAVKAQAGAKAPAASTTKAAPAVKPAAKPATPAKKTALNQPVSASKLKLTAGKPAAAQATVVKSAANSRVVNTARRVA